MDKLIYIRGDKTSPEPQKIEFEIPEGLTIWEFKVVVKRLASSLGYTDNTIVDAFGEDPDKDPNKDFVKKLLKG